MSRIQFETADYFKPSSDEYNFLPFQFMRWSKDEMFLSNEVGEFSFLGIEDFNAFVSHLLDSRHDKYLELKSKHFLYDANAIAPVALLSTKYRTRKSFLEGFTSLHLFVVTLRCDHSCPYCQVSRVVQNTSKFDMDVKTAERAIDLMFRCPSPELKVEFQGGESLLNFDLIKFIVEQVTAKNKVHQRKIDFVVASNLAFLSDEILQYFKEQNIYLSTSLDGPDFIHNANRPRPGGDSYEVTIQNINRAREFLGHDKISALMTTTTLSLKHPRAIVDEYVRQGFKEIFLRAISPYGFAARGREKSQYETDRFIEFYKEALSYIIELNRDGVDITESYAQIILRKILTPFTTGYVDLQSPSGAVIGAVAYNYDGDVYASDEARMLVEMGDKSFRLGNVLNDSFEDIFGGTIATELVRQSIHEILPNCSECAFNNYCGSDPIHNYTTQGDIVGHRPTGDFCSRNMAIIRHLFSLLRGDDSFVRELLRSWGTYQYQFDQKQQ